MSFEDIDIIYDSNIFEHLLESLRLERDMHDATSAVNVFEH